MSGMTDVMKLAMERRSRLMAEIERLKEEANRLNQFIRMGESLIAQANKPGQVAANGADTPRPVADAPTKLTSPVAFGTKG